MDEDCPITDIQLVDSSSAERLSKDYKKLNFINGHKLMFSRKSNNLPLVKFIASSAEQCLNPYNVASLTQNQRL